MFETERIILKKAKKAPKKNNNIKNKLLFKTQEYYPRCLNPRVNHDIVIYLIVQFLVDGNLKSIYNFWKD